MTLSVPQCECLEEEVKRRGAWIHGGGGGGGLVDKLCLTLGSPWTVTLQAPLSMGFPKQEYWSGVPLPSPQLFYENKLFPKEK